MRIKFSLLFLFFFGLLFVVSSSSAQTPTSTTLPLDCPDYPPPDDLDLLSSAWAYECAACLEPVSLPTLAATTTATRTPTATWTRTVTPSPVMSRTPTITYTPGGFPTADPLATAYSYFPLPSRVVRHGTAWEFIVSQETMPALFDQDEFELVAVFWEVVPIGVALSEGVPFRVTAQPSSSAFRTLWASHMLLQVISPVGCADTETFTGSYDQVCIDVFSNPALFGAPEYDPYQTFLYHDEVSQVIFSPILADLDVWGYPYSVAFGNQFLHCSGSCTEPADFASLEVQINPYIVVRHGQVPGYSTTPTPTPTITYTPSVTPTIPSTRQQCVEPYFVGIGYTGSAATSNNNQFGYWGTANGDGSAITTVYSGTNTYSQSIYHAGALYGFRDVVTGQGVSVKLSSIVFNASGSGTRYDATGSLNGSLVVVQWSGDHAFSGTFHDHPFNNYFTSYQPYTQLYFTAAGTANWTASAIGFRWNFTDGVHSGTNAVLVGSGQACHTISNDITPTPVPTNTATFTATPFTAVATFTRTPTYTPTRTPTPGSGGYCSDYVWRSTPTPGATSTGTMTPTFNPTGTISALQTSTGQPTWELTATDVIMGLTQTPEAMTATAVYPQTATMGGTGTAEYYATGTAVAPITATWAGESAANAAVATVAAAATAQATLLMPGVGSVNPDSPYWEDGRFGDVGEAYEGIGEVPTEGSWAFDMDFTPRSGGCYRLLPESIDLVVFTMPLVEIDVCLKYVRLPRIKMVGIVLPLSEAMILMAVMGIFRYVYDFANS